MKTNYVLDGPIGSAPIPYILESKYLVEGEERAFRVSKKLVRWCLPRIMTRAAVKKAMLGPKEFKFSYHYEGRITQDSGNRTSVAIRFGCTTFKGAQYRKLRAWALKETK